MLLGVQRVEFYKTTVDPHWLLLRKQFKRKRLFEVSRRIEHRKFTSRIVLDSMCFMERDLGNSIVLDEMYRKMARRYFIVLLKNSGKALLSRIVALISFSVYIY